MTPLSDGVSVQVDSHAHLDLPEFDPDREAVIGRALDAGVRYLLLIADLTKPPSVAQVAALADRHPGMYWAAGIDPHEAASARQDHFEQLAALSHHPKFMAVGEIGLDYHYDYPREVQQQVFLRQLDLARRLGKPVIIHCRDAWGDLRRMIRDRLTGDCTKSKKEASAGEARAGILHCFTGAPEDALDLVALGFYVSFAGNLTFKKAESLRAAAASVPVERLLTETDCPYLAPVPYRGQRNEPAFVRAVTRELARLREVPAEKMGQQVTANFVELFRIQHFRSG